MADKKIIDLQEIAVVDGATSFLVIDDGTQTYKMRPVNVPGLPRTPEVELDIQCSSLVSLGFEIASGIAYSDKNGQWRLRFNFTARYNTSTATALTFEIAGVTFKDGDHQFVSANVGLSPSFSCMAYASENTEYVNVLLTGSVSDHSVIMVAGDVLLEEMPDWADPAEFRRAEGFFAGEGGAVNSVNGQVGDVSLTTSNIPEGSRLYFTEPRARTAVVDNTITSGVTDKAPSQNAVFVALNGKQSTSEKNQPNGYPGLDGTGKVSMGVIPSALLGGISYQGTWNASSGSYPPSPSKGFYWVTSTAGVILGISYSVKDWMVYNGTSWDKVTGAASTVEAVNGKTGVVVLNTDDVGEGSTNQYFTEARARGAAVSNALNPAVTNIAPSQAAVSTALDTMDSEKQDVSEKGQPNGYVPLNSASKVPTAYLPDISGTLIPPGLIAPYAGATAPEGWIICDGSQVSKDTYADLYLAIGDTYNEQINPTTGSAWAAPSEGNFRIPDMRTLYARGLGTNNLGVSTALGQWQDDATAKNGLTNASSALSGTAAGQTLGTTNVSLASGAAASNGAHTHSVSGTAASAGAHSHNVNIKIGAANNGSGGVKGTAETNDGAVANAAPTSGAHTHSVSGTAASNGAHTHSVSGTTNIGHTHAASAISGTAAAQVISGDAETRPQSRGLNYMIKI